ncbi:aspartate/glutamate racemase family protein [Pseudomonas sp. gcc21]|uniref:aspartate/glutamate racemase family protein n=1 Tax=Pseudomonas sp. gcc21 TaxID=2726989 RepID=UPI00145263D5|nr:aspartate/glutamate racemase family protein [Pseudomonas sp. gcc21]QJD58016.1 aspartate/glutamate racemase family protein [Pseudomonas sp. gcc21]
MKTIGMLGGMSWESTQSYYTALNRGINQQLGGLHSAKIILHSIDFAELAEMQAQDNWDQAAALLGDAAVAVQSAGADFLLICANTMHKVAPAIQQRIGIPILHLADATAGVLKADGITRAGLLGTRYTMEQAFYRERLEAQGIDVLVPEAQDRALVHDIIYSELCQGIVTEQSRTRYLAVIDELAANGAQAVILGCTEIALLVQQQHSTVPLYDTTQIHVNEAIAYAIGHDS